MTEILSALGMSKRFGELLALQDVSFRLDKGEIRALCGENGAGKSTFVKLLTGLYKPDTGVISIDGRAVSIESARHAEKLGIGIVSQELSLAPHLSILDNIWLGSAETPLFYKAADLRRRAHEAMARLGAGDWDLDRHVGELSLGEQQIVEIARLLARDTKVMILDEPTATLSDIEIERILSVLRKLRELGHSIIYISHRLGEIFELCDSISVFRNGRHVATEPAEAMNREQLIELMIGRTFSDMYPSAETRALPAGEVSVTGLNVSGAVHDIGMVARRGEITCVAGQLGSGAAVITRALAGLVPGASGDVRLDGKPVGLGSVRQALQQGIQFVSEDRAGEGIFPELTVLDNLVASRLADHNRGGLISWREMREIGARLAEAATVDKSRLKSHAGVLSGGNQQKILFGRALERGQPSVLIMNEPTRGIDVGARADIYRLMRAFCAQGNAVIMMSSDLEEVVGMADVVYTIFRGRNVGRYDRDAVDMSRILADITHPRQAAGASK